MRTYRVFIIPMHPDLGDTGHNITVRARDRTIAITEARLVVARRRLYPKAGAVLYRATEVK